MSAAYAGLALKRGKNLVFATVALSYARRLALCLMITYGRDSVDA